MLLNVQSVYSLLKSTLRLEDYLKFGHQSGYKALGLADISSLHGILKFYSLAKEYQIKPLIGMRIECLGIYRQDQSYQFLLYAKDFIGYQQLIKISRILENSQLNSLKIWEFLANQEPHLVFISLGKESELEQALIQNDLILANEILTNLISVFGKDSIYLGTQIYPFNSTEIDLVSQFAHSNGINQVAAQQVNTLQAEEAISLQILDAIQQNQTINSSELKEKGTHYLFTENELKSLYAQAGLDYVWQATLALVDQLNVDFKLGHTYLPKFHAPDNLSSDDYLEQLVTQALNLLGYNQQDDYINRLNKELNVIKQMGFSDYFLIVGEIIGYCHQVGIRVGPGRGSAAGSLVSYLLKITSVDPVAYKLFFERFLNPERHNMPDIDVDIADDRRAEVLKYIQNKYGYNQVAQIVTMGTFGAKAAIRDTLRILGEDSQTLKKWSRTIPSDANQLMTLERAYKESPAFRQIVDQNERNRDIFQAAQTIEGVPRHLSTHAASVVINDFPLDELIPVKDREGDLLITQFDMYDIEKIGLLKMDFLGLRNLSILEDIIQVIQRHLDTSFDIETINMNDPETLKLFQTGETLGVFQFESDGIRNLLRKLKPGNFEDIVAVNALYRPGPMKQIDTFIARKRRPETINYLHPSLQKILESTYGVIVYQEQVMQIVVEMAGYSLGEADLLRRAISKKEISTMEAEREHFIQGALQRGYQVEEAEKVYQYIYEFSNYGFNRAHAVVYSTLAFQLAYCKAHYPLAFYAAILNSGSSQQKTQQQYIQEAKARKINILGIDINESQGLYTGIHDLRVGFNAVRGLRSELIQHILVDRSQVGPYLNLKNFLYRLPQNLLKTSLIEPLILVGAFDSFEYNRKTLMENLPSIIQGIEYSGKSLSLFNEVEPKITWHEEYTIHEILEYEESHLGYTLSPHPISKYNHLIEKDKTFSPIESLSYLKKSKNIKTIALIKSIKVILTKTNQQMAFAMLTDGQMEIELVVFPQTYQRFLSFLKENKIVVVIGKLESRNHKIQIICQSLDWPENIKINEPVQEIRCFIRINNYHESVDQITTLKQLALENPGPAPIILVDSQKRTLKLDDKFNLSTSFRVMKLLEDLFGVGNIVFH